MDKLLFNERIVLSNLSKRWCWIARDDDDGLFLFKNKPTKNNNTKAWDTDMDFINFSCYSHMFRFIDWNNKEPYKISSLLEDEYE